MQTVQEKRTQITKGNPKAKKPLRIALCEDDVQDRDHLLELIAHIDPRHHIESFEKGEDLLDGYTPGYFDLIFMDIYFQSMQGTDVVSIIRKVDKTVVITFCTVSADHALDGYRLGVLKYIEKPATTKAVEEALELAYMRRHSERTINVPSSGGMIEVPLNSILSIEMKGHAVAIHLEAETLLASQSMRLGDIEALLPKPQFLRCHRGYIVNLARVKRLDGADFITDDDRRIYVRLKDKSKLHKAYYDFVLTLNKSGV